jgi:glycine/D-amino acid oxidase-like deaminating enzyme
MAENRPPWLYQMKFKRQIEILNKDFETDIAIIGGGIAGVSTAFFALEHTNQKVTLIEKDLLAHGATGHNAGYVVNYIERPFNEIIEEFGEEMALDGYMDLESGWEKIDHMYEKASLDIPFTKIIGYAGFSTKERVFSELKTISLQRKRGIPVHKIILDKNVDWIGEILPEWNDSLELAERSEILSLLESKDDQYLACLPYKVACANSARFCEEIVEYMERTYPDRFRFFEHTPIEKILLREDGATLDALKHEIKTKRVVMCTNGFEKIRIINEGSLEIDTKFHHEVWGVIGYMAAYSEALDKAPFAAEYYTREKIQEEVKGNDPYFYVTRRPYDFGGKSSSNLISIGGPEIYLEDSEVYSRNYEYPEDAQEKIEEFAKKTFENNPIKDVEPFLWHGLMGYTKNMIRLIGEEPKNKILLYNLGCNGVGVLSSVYGGFKVGSILGGKVFPYSIFDPK